MNIIFFVTNLDSGGIENYLLRYLQEERSKFKDVYVYCKSGRGGELENEYKKIKDIHIIKRKFGYLNIRSMINLGLFLSKNDINAVCDFTGNFSGLVLFTASKLSIKKRIALYRSSTNRFKEDLLRSFYNQILNTIVKRYSTDILANSTAGLNYFFNEDWQDNSKFGVVQNGINPDKFLSKTTNLRDEFNIPLDAFVIGHTGRYNSAKNHKTIISVAESLVKGHKDIYFILCGKGVYSNLHEELLKKGLSNRILVFENRNDIPNFLNSMDCYFFPSITEGQPNSLIEAMLMGLPYVCSNIDPIKETVFDLMYLYDPYDKNAFIEALTHFYNIRVTRNIELQKKTINKFNHKKAFSLFTSRIYN